MDGQCLNISNKTFWVDTFPFNEVFIKNCTEKSDEGYFLEVDVQYLKKLHDLHKHLPFLHERMKKLQIMILKKNVLSWWIMLFLEKLWKMGENIEILKVTSDTKLVFGIKQSLMSN